MSLSPPPRVESRPFAISRLSEGFDCVGRQALIGDVKWGADQWPTINAAIVPNERALSARLVGARNTEYSFVDDFTSRRLMPGW